MNFEEFMKSFKKIEPLSNFQIIQKCKELNIKNFKGVFMRDEIKNKRPTDNECMVINIDHSNNQGTHWTCLFIDKGKSYYFDSYGFEPTVEVKEYCKEPRVYSSFEIQQTNEIICGHYCIYVLYRLSNGDEFDDILDELYRRSRT
jgi:hypothetical protein